MKSGTESKRLVIAGTGSGSGKTTVTLGIMAALQRRGLTVQGFKCGPDYIDPTYHTAVTGRASRNLDSWMLPRDTVKEIYVRASADADISIIEGVMGFYDGRDPKSNTGSTADISLLLESPVLLVVDGSGMARSAAAIVRGFQSLEPRVRIAAVFANNVGSEGHYRIIREAVEQECGVPVIGYLKRDAAIVMPERHLGLVPSVERGELNGLFELLARTITETTDLERLLQLAGAAPFTLDGSSLFVPAESPVRVRIAVALDAAFHFYYPENLELLELGGAELAFFSPLAGETLPEGVQGLYIGGGFPEEFAERLTAQEQVTRSLREAISAGLPTLAECGGFMYLTEAIEDTQGRSYPMLGVLPGRVTMQTKLAALGYREVKGLGTNPLLPEGDIARGHEFHYSVYKTESPMPSAYESKGLRGMKPEGCLKGNVIAGYTHLHFGSNPAVVRRWLELCAAPRNRD
ncbi:cobyrinate a,c-diamide synthase [Paenibacillus filicis]|uniref:Cobyrinate a,c-diamide synthase n=1 Tax=Paenibacillus gyeongsangnamensis TaxID=3388067 RepID=A0ABT4QHK2_9BACL|nr:cobyrinate a,c-diamide synthase [Paenibacillus filicis]MCZ8516353.1 cobyrinate a,c-diamide synthase [Paenibacillus filicis]